MAKLKDLLKENFSIVGGVVGTPALGGNPFGKRAKLTKSNIITISFVENSEIQELSNYNFVIENNNKYIFPILSVIPLQKLAFMSALNLGLDPDRPQNLAKTVTVE